jgi:hypothetical protein
MELRDIAENLGALSDQVESNDHRPSAEAIAARLRVQQTRLVQVADAIDAANGAKTAKPMAVVSSPEVVVEATSDPAPADFGFIQE